ncbi:M14 family zinc carboxypeptidase [Bacteroidota bacterium]
MKYTKLNLENVLKKLSFILLFISFTNSIFAIQLNNPQNELLSLVRISSTDKEKLKEELIKANFDVISTDQPSSVDIIVNSYEMKELEKRGLTYILVRRGSPLKYMKSSEKQGGELPVGYLSLEEIYTRMQEFATENPSIAKVYDLTEDLNTPVTSEGRHLFALKISDNVAIEEDEPDFLIVGNHHAREVVTPVIALNAMSLLTAGYGIDPTITEVINNNEIWIAPTWNPDGYNHVYNVDNYWRKNRRVFNEGIGVDQNRNYPHEWNGPYSGSTNPASSIYKGPSAGSEAETRTMIAFGNDQRFEKLIDYHSSGREVLWGFHDPTHPFDSWFHEEAEILAVNSGYIGDGNTRKPSASGENYHWHLAYTGSYAFLIETHTMFTPSYSSALAEANMLWPGIISCLLRKIPLSGHVRDEHNNQPLVANIEIDGINFVSDEINESGGLFGAYHLYLPAGEYDIIFSADGYADEEVHVIINSDSEEILDVQLVPIDVSIENIIFNSSSENIILNSNYPNPFNKLTNIEFILSEPELVSLDIYNINGQYIKSLINKQIYPKGTNTVKWDGTNSKNRKMPSGIYIIKIHSGNSIKTRKCILTKD